MHMIAYRYLRLFTLLLAVLAIFSVPSITQAADLPSKSRTCPDAQLFGPKLITDICWGCLFPIRLMGAKLGGGDAPSGASNKALCACFDNAGIPEPGMGIGYWEPARLVEVVREAGCAPSLGGMSLPGSSRRMQGTPGSDENDSSDLGFYQYHYYAFPLLLMLDLFVSGGCFSDGMMDFDIMYLSELDPTWNNDQLAFFTNPEAAAVANLPAQSACVADAAMAAAGEPTEALWWCAGAWGSLYPLSGKVMTTGFANMTSLLSAKAIGALHRRGLAQRTMGADAMCESVIEPMLKKSQYKFNMFFPVAEAQDSHVLGETVLTWGAGRMIPAAGEDAVYTVFRWNDCCMRW